MTLDLQVQLQSQFLGTRLVCFCFRDGKLHRHLVGMVVCSLSWWRGEWVGFTLGVSLGPVVRRVLLPDAYVPSSVSLMPPDTFPNQLGTP